MDRLWSEANQDDPAASEALVVDVDGFEGPLDLLLHLARTQKVDLARISVLALTEQYLIFIDRARELKLEIAADYLVMAAWLAYLKSKLLIPQKPGEDEQTGDEMAAILQFRLQRLEAMRDAGTRLVNRNRLGRDIFARGMPETVVVDRKNQFEASLYDLLTAYASQRQRNAITSVQIEQRHVWSLKDARERLVSLVGVTMEWTALDSFLIDYLALPEERTTAIASSFAASLELVREGAVQLSQSEPFSTLYLRSAPAERRTKNNSGETMHG